LRGLIADNPKLTARFKSFMAALDEQYPTIRAAHASSGAGSARMRASAGLSTLVRKSIDSLHAEEDSLLRMRRIRREQHLRLTGLLMGSGFLGAVLIGLFGFWLGLSELRYREQGELSLQELAERLNSVLESTLDCVVAAGNDLRIIYLNKRAGAVLGVAAARGEMAARFHLSGARWSFCLVPRYYGQKASRRS
jgi:PAS domain-containing protein